MNLGRRTLGLLLVLVLLISLTSPTLAAGEKVTLKLWTGWQPDHYVYKTYEAGLARFMEEHPNIEVIHETVAWGDINSKAIASTAAGDVPNAVWGWDPVSIVSAATDLTEWIERVIAQEEEDFFEHGLLAAKIFRERKLDATAIICFNDEMGFGVLQGLLRSGIRVPQDISLVSFDGCYRLPQTSPRLSSVTCKPMHMGAMLADPVKFVACGGIDPLVKQACGFTGSQNRMSKRGSPYLRRALWLAATVAYRHDPTLAAFLPEITLRQASSPGPAQLTP